MNSYEQRIDSLDVSLFEAITSQTSEGDRRSLLAIQRTTARNHGQFNYLEIGSHLGGTIQPYLLDDRCKKIYSIDPRPSSQPDDRASGYIAYYPENSAERMIEHLKGIGYGDIEKIHCIDLDASQVAPGQIPEVPEVLFIDGEHTRSAVISDFGFCQRVASKTATIVFHDTDIVDAAIEEVCERLKRENRKHTPLKLEGTVFAIFFDHRKVRTDPYLNSIYQEQLSRKRWSWLKAPLKRLLPEPTRRAIRSALNRPA